MGKQHFGLRQPHEPIQPQASCTMMLQSSTARHLAADALQLKPQALTERWTEKTRWPGRAEMCHRIMKTREKTENTQNRRRRQLGFFAYLAPPPFPSASAPSSSVLQLLAGSRARRPAKSLSEPWTGPDGLGGPQRVQLCREQNNISGSHTRGGLMAQPPFLCWGFPVVPTLTHSP